MAVKRWTGETAAAQFEGPKRVYLMKISKKLNYMLTCIFSDGNAKPNPIMFSERRSETRIFKSGNLFLFSTDCSEI
jgi:hypothetical protein